MCGLVVFRQLEKQGTVNGMGTGNGNRIYEKGCTGRDETIACTDLVHKLLQGWLRAHCNLVHELSLYGNTVNIVESGNGKNRYTCPT